MNVARIARPLPVLGLSVDDPKRFLAALESRLEARS